MENMDIKRIATAMIARGHTPPRVADDNFDGWTNDLMGIIEEIYQIETQVREAIEAQDVASILLRVTPYEAKILRTTLEEEIDRNASEYPDINGACGAVLDQLRKPGRPTIYLLQYDQGGVPDDPRPFVDEKEADEAYIQEVNDIFSTNFTDFKQASDFMSNNWGNTGVRLYEIEI